MNKNAFTLAEVLLTLGIIGIIAAMVIPTLVVKHQKKEMEVRLVKFYSAFSQAYKMAEAKNGPSYTWEYENSYTVNKIMRYIIPEMKTLMTCGASNIDSCRYSLQKYLLQVKDGEYSGFIGNQIQKGTDTYAIFPQAHF